MAVLTVLVVVVAVNSFLYFDRHAPAVQPAPSTEPTPQADEGTGLSTVLEPTGGQEEEGQRSQETTGETTVPSRGAATTTSPALAPLPLPRERTPAGIAAQPSFLLAPIHPTS